MYRRLCLIAAAIVLFVATVPLLAQDAEPVATSTATQNTSESFAQAFFISEDKLGQAIIAVLVLASVCVIGYGIKLFMDVRRSAIAPDDTADEIEQMLTDKRYKEAIEFAEGDGSFLARLLSSALGEAASGFAAMERAIEEAGDAETSRLLRPVEYLNVIGNIAPMLGLFGTVYGMIRAFTDLVAAGGKPDPQQLAAGISTALVTTFWGLIVAMPALAIYAIIRNKIDALTSEGVLIAEELIRPFKPGRAPKPRPASPKSQPEAE